MTVSLNRNYGAYPAGSVVQLNASTEAALIAQNLANPTANPVTAGNVTSNEHNGRVQFAAGAASLIVTNPTVNAGSKVTAQINGTTTDTAMTSVRVVPAVGSFTIYGNAAANAAVLVDWDIVSTGLTPQQ